MDALTLDDYHLMGNKCDEQTTFIISNCSMGGEAHNQLSAENKARIGYVPQENKKDEAADLASIYTAEEECEETAD